MFSALLSLAAAIAVPLLVSKVDSAITNYKRGAIGFDEFEQKVSKAFAKYKNTHQEQYDQAMSALSQIPYQSGSASVQKGRRQFIRDQRKKAKESSAALNKLQAGEQLVQTRLARMQVDPTEANKQSVTSALNTMGISVENPA